MVARGCAEAATSMSEDGALNSDINPTGMSDGLIWVPWSPLIFSPSLYQAGIRRKLPIYRSGLRSELIWT